MEPQDNMVIYATRGETALAQAVVEETVMAHD